MGKKLIFVLVLIVVALVLVAVFSGDSVEAPSSVGNPEETSSGNSIEDSPLGDAVRLHSVVYTNSGFSPESITVNVGETVLFSNQSSVNFWPASAMHPTHSVYGGTTLSEHCPDGSSAFDACTAIAPGGEWSFTFAKPGTWRYHDHLTPGRFGAVIVE